MDVRTLFTWMVALWPVGFVTSQPYVLSQNFAALGNDGSTMYVSPEGVIGNHGQIVGYGLVPADGPYNQQSVLPLEQSLLDNYATFVQPSLPRQSFRGGHQIAQSNGQIRRSEVYYPRNVDQSYENERHAGHAVYGTSREGKKAGYGKKRQRVKVLKKPVYVPVPIKRQKKKKKKSKTLSVSKGFYIAGGNQVFGKFKTLKSCQKACDNTAHCFGGDYDKWTKRCYMHTNTTACGALQPHKKLTHFKKVPCAANDLGIGYGRITLGANLDHGLLQKGVKDIQTCIKKCLQAGGGVAGPLVPGPGVLIPPAVLTILGTPQLCFGIDYDFATHKCYFHTSVTVIDADAALLASEIVRLQGIPGGIACVAQSNDAAPRQPTNLLSDSSVVNIVICPTPMAG